MLIYTGRFQPFHNGHLSILIRLHEMYPNEVICVAIIKDYAFYKEKNAFDRRVDAELLKNDYRFNAEKTLSVITKIIKNRDLDNVVTTLMPRASNESWTTIKYLFDCKRTWVFTENLNEPDEWENIKLNFYKSMGEDIIQIPINKSINGTDIRQYLQEGDYSSLSKYLPSEVVQSYGFENTKDAVD